MKIQIVAVVASMLLASCGSIQRAETAQKAQASMVGFSKEEILTCAGAPARQAVEGATEVWEYFAYTGMREDRSCTVNLTFLSGSVSSVRYNEINGGLLTPNSSCAYAVRSCVR